MIEPALYDNERRFIFNNWTSEDFPALFGGETTIIKAGETKEFGMFKAYLFTKHLVDREMIRDGKENSMSAQEMRQDYEDKTIAEITSDIDSPALASIKEKIKEEIAVETGKKKAASKKVVAEVKDEEETEFADIK